MKGTPIAEENFAAASVMAVARLLSRSGNQYPSALALLGKVGDSATPSRNRAAIKVPSPGDSAAPNEAMLQRNVPILPTRRTPKRSSSTPAGICMTA